VALRHVIGSSLGRSYVSIALSIDKSEARAKISWTRENIRMTDPLVALSPVVRSSHFDCAIQEAHKQI